MSHARENSKKDRIAYTIPIPFGNTLEVKSSANAWWMDKQKLHSLIAALRIGCPIKEACSYTNISLRQYKYFVSLHPIFAEAKEGYRLEPKITARLTLMKAIYSGDVKICLKYLEKKYPEEFGKDSQRAKNSATPQQLYNEADHLSDEEKELFAKLRQARKKRIEESIRKQQ